MAEIPVATAVRSRGGPEFGAVDEGAATVVVAKVRDVDSVAVDKVLLGTLMDEVLVVEICWVVRDDLLRAESVLPVDVDFRDEDLVQDVLVVMGCLPDEVLLGAERVLMEENLVLRRS
ncbi:hypothetical protein AC579_8457 [Pseudocercospora musae]|uniref:Uncharacterized protein n=1 Tax=Pseudocercospora musae TaxID=113226 RepID=A0A139I096_9PEZI|nr:hypothetical protein AC579_8457 [Pseudocercospora musae]